MSLIFTKSLTRKSLLGSGGKITFRVVVFLIFSFILFFGMF
ncbi:hypothetical protein FG05_35269 [Fusarium graminearum]|nr:hypothetical protein FG05_35269 [Fusarium graminearum]